MIFVISCGYHSPLAEHHQLFSNLSMAALQQALATTTQELLCRGNASTVLSPSSMGIIVSQWFLTILHLVV